MTHDSVLCLSTQLLTCHRFYFSKVLYLTIHSRILKAFHSSSKTHKNVPMRDSSDLLSSGNEIQS